MSFVPVQPIRGRPMPCSDSARLLRPHLMQQAGWLPAEGLRLWDTCRHRTRRSAVTHTGACGGSGPLSERGAGSGFHTWGSRTSPRGFGTCPRESGPVEAGPEHFVQVDTWQRQTCHLVGSGPGSHCPPTVRSGLLCPAAQRLSARLLITSRLFGLVAVGEGTPV